MEPITGIVQWVTLAPGRSDCVFVIFEGDTESSGHSLNADTGKVYWEGEEINSITLFSRLITNKHPISARLYPDADNYGNAMKAEFWKGDKAP